jgi:Na+-transporting NADH:ubiquinone oxidoreductase subunit NqrA
MDTVLQRSRVLKEALTDFVLDAEGDLAVALETFSADQLTRSQKQNMHQRTLVIDRFITEGQVNQQSPIDLFLQTESDLSESDRQLLLRWKQSFVGLFAITKILEDGFELMNWTTAKHYVVKPNDEKTWQDMARLKAGEIILTQIAPITETDWIFSSPWTSLGKLGKPKLAVAIGNFKDNYKQHLYSDAPDC